MEVGDESGKMDFRRVEGMVSLTKFINRYKSPCCGEGYRNTNELFIHLGGRNLDTANFPNPKYQNFEDTVLTDGFGINDARDLRYLQHKLRGSVQRCRSGSDSKSKNGNTEDLP